MTTQELETALANCEDLSFTKKDNYYEITHDKVAGLAYLSVNELNKCCFVDFKNNDIKCQTITEVITLIGLGFYRPINYNPEPLITQTEDVNPKYSIYSLSDKITVELSADFEVIYRFHHPADSLSSPEIDILQISLLGVDLTGKLPKEMIDVIESDIIDKELRLKKTVKLSKEEHAEIDKKLDQALAKEFVS
jgi:hypothetical protein